MALKAILESLDGLPDAVKPEYKKGDDGKFHLDVEGIDDHPGVGALKRAKDYEKSERQKAAKQLSDLQTQLDALTEERDGILKGAIPKVDVEKLENSYKEKLNKREKELSDQIGALTGNLQTMLVDNVAQSIAIKISRAPDLMLPHIKARLKAEFNEGKAVTRVLDEDGNPSASSIEDLQKELFTNPIFAPIIIGSKASGSGADGGHGGQGNGGVNPWSHDGWNLTEQGKVYLLDSSKAEQMARAAGTHVGGPRPKPKS